MAIYGNYLIENNYAKYLTLFESENISFEYMFESIEFDKEKVKKKLLEVWDAFKKWVKESWDKINKLFLKILKLNTDHDHYYSPNVSKIESNLPDINKLKFAYKVFDNIAMSDLSKEYIETIKQNNEELIDKCNQIIQASKDLSTSEDKKGNEFWNVVENKEEQINQIIKINSIIKQIEKDYNNKISDLEKSIKIFFNNKDIKDINKAINIDISTLQKILVKINNISSSIYNITKVRLITN